MPVRSASICGFGVGVAELNTGNNELPLCVQTLDGPRSGLDLRTIIKRERVQFSRGLSRARAQIEHDAGRVMEDHDDERYHGGKPATPSKRRSGPRTQQQCTVCTLLQKILDYHSSLSE